MTLYITAVHPGTATDYQGFTHYRWLQSGNGNAGTSTRATLVSHLSKDGNTAFVAGESGPAKVEVVGAPPNQHLRTHQDDKGDNNLENLPRF